MNSEERNTPAQIRKSRIQLLLIMGIAVVSLGGAWLLYLAAESGAMWGTTNKGTFVTPPMTAAELDLQDSQGRGIADSEAWWLWVVPEDACDQPCRDALHQLRQLHVLLNKDANRVRRALVTADGIAPADIVDQYPKLLIFSANLQSLAPGIYVVDPFGNLVFHYPMKDAGAPVLDDLKRLLKVSQIG